MENITKVDKLRIRDVEQGLESDKILVIDSGNVVRWIDGEPESILIYNISKGCYVIQSNTGKVYMIDAGEEYMGYDAVSFIQNKLEVHEVEKIFITHYHYNHVGGVAPVINSMPVGSVLSNGTYSAETREPYGTLDPLAKSAMLDAIAMHNIPYSYHKQGDEFIEGDLKFTFWAPLDEYATKGGTTTDPNGMTGAMIRLDYKDFSILFGGDINREDEVLEIWAEQTDLKTDAFAWPHHGDPNTAKDAIIDPMNLRYAFIEDLSRSKSVIGYLEAKHIEYGWLIGNEYTGIKAYENGTFEKLERKDYEYDVLELSCENQTELNLGIKTRDNSAWIIDFGDGNKATGISEISSAYNIKHTYTHAFTGNIKILMPKGGLEQIEEFRSSANGFNFDISILPNSIKFLDLKTSTEQAITGDIGDSPSSLEHLHVTGINTLTGVIDDLPVGLKHLHIAGNSIITGLIDNAPRSLEYIRLLSANHAIGGLIDNAPPKLYWMEIYAENNNFGGLIDNAPRSLTRLRVTGATTIGGDIGNAPPNIEYLYIFYQQIGGLIDNAPRSLTYLRVTGDTTIGGDIGNAPDGVKNIQVLGDSEMTSYTRKTWAQGMNLVQLRTSIPSEDVDNLIIDLSQTTWSASPTGLSITSTNGMGRTSESDHAVLHLESMNVEVIVRVL